MLGSPEDSGTAAMKRPPMRSSIACLRCRKSKIKCDNDGGNAPCDTCIKTGKECKYPEAMPMPPKRPDPPAVNKSERDGGSERKRLKRVDDATRLEIRYSGAGYAEEVLSAPYLTETVWLQCFDIYRLHFATELAFLHMPTLKEIVSVRFRTNSPESAPEINFVLLGILTLTARFHPDLVKYVNHAIANQPGNTKPRPSQVKPDATGASEYFADALTKALGPLRTSMTTASVERVQAFLMLGLFEWSQARPRTGGLGAWMYVGLAIRQAQALGLGFGDAVEKTQDLGATISRRPKLKASLPHEEMLTLKEVRRRTMFSCLILDRMLSCGKERVSTIRSEDLQIQLPCTEVDFDLCNKVNTGFLQETAAERCKNNPQNDSVLARFVRLVDIWGEISKFSFSGGRLTESAPPWDTSTQFYKLRQKLEDFYSDLPPSFTLSSVNYHRHENHHASSVFISMHMLGSLCQIMLHREFIPFIPIRCRKPIGPLDEPTFPAGKYKIPDHFWEDSAEKVFKSARDIVDLVQMSRDKLPMSSLVAFAIWTAAFDGIYAWHFPHMDQGRHMLKDNAPDNEGENITNSGPTGITLQTLTRMSGWLKMAGTYAKYFKDMDKFYTRVIQDYKRHVGRTRLPDSQPGEGRKSIRQGGDGGGLDEWRVQNAKVVNNGTILAEDEKPDGSDRSRASTIDRSSIGPDSNLAASVASANSAASGDRRTPRSTPALSMPSTFTAINNATGLVQHELQDGLPTPADGSGGSWSRYSTPLQHPTMLQSPVQSAYTTAPHGLDMTPMYSFTPQDMFPKYYDTFQDTRIGDVTQDLPGFSYAAAPAENGSLFGHHNAALVQPYGGFAAW